MSTENVPPENVSANSWVCEYCGSDVRDEHCTNVKNVTKIDNASLDEINECAGHSDESSVHTCMGCSQQKELSLLQIRWHVRPKPKDNRSAHWDWIYVSVCATCERRLVDANDFARGWDFWDAMDGICE